MEGANGALVKFPFLMLSGFLGKDAELFPVTSAREQQVLR